MDRKSQAVVVFELRKTKRNVTGEGGQRCVHACALLPPTVRNRTLFDHGFLSKLNIAHEITLGPSNAKSRSEREVLPEFLLLVPYPLSSTTMLNIVAETEDGI